MNSKTILRNSAWYGLETLIGYASSLITSVVIARTLGPTKMGYIVYVLWIVTITCSLGSVGIPATTRKYMSEFLGRDDRATARAIYFRTFFLQFGVALLATVGAVIWVMHDAPAGYRVAALLLVCSTLPAMSNFVSAQANVASENLSANLPASAWSSFVYFVTVLCTVFFHWGVVGVAAATFLMRATDFSVRFVPTCGRIYRWPTENAQVPADLWKRMRSFAAQSLMGMLLTLVVWDRSEIFLLKHLSGDLRQLAFYSVSLGLADRLLIVPSIFGAATGVTILAQYGRDASRLPAMTAAALRYLALSSVPVHVVATAMVGPALLIVYGHQYAGAFWVATASPLLCLPKAFLGPIQSLFESTEEQRFFLFATVFASMVDIGVAWVLIPKYGALGACIGSGLAQMLAVSTMWAIGVVKYRIALPYGFLLKLVGISSAAAVAAYLASFRLPSVIGLAAGTVAACVCFGGLAVGLRLLEAEDAARLLGLLKHAPAWLRPSLERFVAVATRSPIQREPALSSQ